MKKNLVVVAVVTAALLGAMFVASADSDAGWWDLRRGNVTFNDAAANSYLTSSESFSFFYDMHVKAGGQWYLVGNEWNWDGHVCGQYFRWDGYTSDWKCANGWNPGDVHIEGFDSWQDGPEHTMRINMARNVWHN